MVRVHKIGIELRIVASQGPDIIYSGGSRISPRSGRQLSGGGGHANIRFCQFFPKTA